MIESNYNQNVSVQRLTTVTGNKKDYQDHIERVVCHIQALESKITQDIEGGFGKDKLMFCAVQDIEEGDRVIHGSDTYRVVGVEKYNNFLKRSNHMEVIIRIFKS